MSYLQLHDARTMSEEEELNSYRLSLHEEYKFCLSQIQWHMKNMRLGETERIDVCLHCVERMQELSKEIKEIDSKLDKLYFIPRFGVGKVQRVNKPPDRYGSGKRDRVAGSLMPATGPIGALQKYKLIYISLYLHGIPLLHLTFG